MQVMDLLPISSSLGSGWKAKTSLALKGLVHHEKHSHLNTLARRYSTCRGPTNGEVTLAFDERWRVSGLGCENALCQRRKH